MLYPARMRTILTTLHSKFIHPSLALPCLVAYCGQDCGELLIDEYTIHQPKENILAGLLARAPDVVCFSVYIWNRQLSMELAVALKVAAPQIHIVMGGPEVSFEEAGFFDACPIDALVCGEGEIPLRHLLMAWQEDRRPSPCPGLQRPGMSSAVAGQSLLDPLDKLPSPFAAGLVDLTRGYVYYETSRGCPYSCSFCLSARDEAVRSFSLSRIYADLDLLLDARVAQIKFVDRTFNFNAKRCREIIRHILKQNRGSHIHFEIGADLLDEETLQLLASVPAGMFQFEIGVQTTNAATLGRIGRKASLEKLETNVRRLLKAGNIHLHLDLIAGLPGESREEFYQSLRRVFTLAPHHLQVELVKLLPGAPLRYEAQGLGLHFDPSPPYRVLRTPDLSFAELEGIRGVGRLVDLLHNSGRFTHLLTVIPSVFESLVEFYRQLEVWWQKGGLFENSMSLQQLFEAVHNFIGLKAEVNVLHEALARDFALAGRVVPGKAPAFFNCALTREEEQQVKIKMKTELDKLSPGEKLQHFATIYKTLPEAPRCLVLYLYRSSSGQSPTSEEIFL